MATKKTKKTKKTKAVAKVQTRVVTKRDWTEIEKKRAATMKKNGTKRGRRSLDPKVIVNIKKALARGVSNAVIADKAGVSRGFISQIKHGRVYASVTA